ncbi:MULTISPECIES: hypothetical protein [Glutamicibacter]|uniref:Hypothetical secreted protein n=1 Tax=Glutamicibacter arilaitensis (strain DSM 16368 / CIP 108037 / IAM 15318 / JCM 13566 / NCIMB 14258 / Re117) TaxID=861360 RepID=A0ABM9PY29_GLUAR|nr:MULTISPECIES: hypothetical protein [Glutamicibacter]CBT76269.1 hypothetical secreted protein [Glutamicibacter arilaitensis Re117]HCH48293.1 hypothetical protein [Glutamicibacter sp.]
MKTKLAALAVIASLALAGCSAGNQSADATPSPTAASSAQAVASPTPSVSVNSVALSAADIAKKKQEAIDSGRPESDWDINCIAWEWPEADSKGQKWANDIGIEWLESHGAKCPDQIPYPYYYVDSFANGTDGELVIIMDNASYENPEVLAMLIMDELAEDHPELDKITAHTRDERFTGTYTRADYDRSIAVENGTYIYP